MKFEEQLDIFIKKWCGNMYAHLSDTDENDGEELREFVRNNYLDKQKVRETIKELTHNTDLGEAIHPDELLKKLGLE